jgi:hypothetical protein
VVIVKNRRGITSRSTSSRASVAELRIAFADSSIVAQPVGVVARTSDGYRSVLVLQCSGRAISMMEFCQWRLS